LIATEVLLVLDPDIFTSQGKTVPPARIRDLTEDGSVAIVRFPAVGVLAALLTLSGVLAAEGVDPRIASVLYTGDPYPGQTPYRSMQDDAFLQVTPVLASSMHTGHIPWEDIRRSMRVYMARTYDQYVGKYDVLIISDSNRNAFKPEQHLWFRDGVLDHGMGLLMVSGHETFAGGFGHDGWEDTPAEEVLPVTIPVGGATWVNGGAMVKIVAPEQEFIRSLPFDPPPLYMRTGIQDGDIVQQKDGSTLLAHWISNEYGDPPFYVTWDIEQGRTFAMMHDWTLAAGHVMLKWDYYPDYAINLMLYLAKRDLFPEYVQAHEYRAGIRSLNLRKLGLLALIEFVESFGGNTLVIDREITRLNSMVKAVEEHYLDHDLSAALRDLDGTIKEIQGIEELATRVKERALLWVYVIEWFSVTAVMLMSGMILWSLMVRRRLYREVGETRLMLGE
jgi:uncharacterized membrane protein